ncbi:MAG: cation diffusion facilitator family transporter [Gemmobacter sp.]
MTRPDPYRLNLTAAAASLTVALLLVAIKVWALWMTGALSVAASLADSALDLVMSLGALTAIVYAARPPDADHAFGHSSAEDLTALAQAAFILGAALAIGWHGALRFLAAEPTVLAAEGAGMVAMAVSAVLTLALVLWQGHVARRTGNRVVAADRLHYVGDLLPTLGALAALYASARWGLWQIDSIVALVAAGVMIAGAFRIGRGALDALMDRAADPEVVADIARIADNWPGLRGWHDLKTRTAGSRVFVHLHIELDGALPLAEAHEIGAALRRAILDSYPQADVIIHKDVARPRNGHEHGHGHG